MTVRQVQREDVKSLSRVLISAFADDPILRWTYPGERSSRFWGRRFFDWDLRRLYPEDVCWTTDDHAGAALWALPDRWREAPGDIARLAVACGPGILPHAPRTMRGLTLVEHKHSLLPAHLYLAVLGVEPGRQAKGLGSKLIAPGLELCDREALPAYLETGKERNLAFYGRQGFVVTEELTLPHGPRIWLMWREPR